MGKQQLKNGWYTVNRTDPNTGKLRPMNILFENGLEVQHKWADININPNFKLNDFICDKGEEQPSSGELESMTATYVDPRYLKNIKEYDARDLFKTQPNYTFIEDPNQLFRVNPEKTIFIVNTKRYGRAEKYLVNTEGYDYARYVLKIK